MNESRSQRLSQEDQCHQTPVRSILEQAESVARRVLESVQAIAGTTACKGIQIARLAGWAKKNGYWIDNGLILGDYADRGSKNEGNYSANEVETLPLAFFFLSRI